MVEMLAKRYFPNGCTVAEFVRASGACPKDVRERVRIYNALKVAGLLKTKM